MNDDSYNELCKDCKNYRRRLAYYRRLERRGLISSLVGIEALSYVWPLNDHNRKLLRSLTPKDSWQFFDASLVKDGSKVSVRLRLTEKFPTIEIQVGDDVTTYQCGSQTFDQFVETAVLILRDLGIRLG